MPAATLMIVLPNGRELRQLEDGAWEVQPPNDNYWSHGQTPAEAFKEACWGGRDGCRKDVYDIDGNRGELLYLNSRYGFAIVDWAPSGGYPGKADLDGFRYDNQCFGCGDELSFGDIQTRQYHPNWQEARCERCGREAVLEEQGPGNWVRCDRPKEG